MAFELRRVEIDWPQAALRIARCLVCEMPGAGVTAFAAGGHGPGPNRRPEFNHGDEATGRGDPTATGCAAEERVEK